ncbi:hypothetical protein N9093_01745, partial [bacterium]|nr:hypothetical protein [bacterium]
MEPDLPPENESTTELRILLEFGFIKGETQWDENVIQPSRSKLRIAEVETSKGQTIGLVCRKLEIS